MNLRAVALALIILALLAMPGFAVTITIETTDGAMTLNAGQIDVLSNRFVAIGKAHVHWTNTAKKFDMNADAEKMVVTTMPAQAPAPKAAPPKGGKAKKPAGTAIKSAVLTGPVTLVYIRTDATGKSKITGNADNADFDAIANLAHLVGNVKIVNDNPAMFSKPATMDGDKATINLKPNGPDDFNYRFETAAPGGTISGAGKAKAEQNQ